MNAFEELKQNMIGKTIKAEGFLFSWKEDLELREYLVKGARRSRSTMIDMESGKEYSCFELLLSSKYMKRAKWTKAFKLEEIEPRVMAFKTNAIEQ